MAELIANEDYSLKVTTLGGWIPGDPNTPSDATVIILLASKAKGNNKAFLINQISWVMIVGACTFSGHTHVSGVSLPPIIATAIKCKCDVLPVMRHKDTGICIGVFTNNVSGATVPCSCNFEIDDAGQTKVKGN